MPSWLDDFKQRRRDFGENMAAGPPWPAKFRPLLANRLRALRHGCCGHPGQPGC